jgi:hypothetical protein
MAINATLSANDAILVMQTGGGKSLCFQLPALLQKGFIHSLFFQIFSKILMFFMKFFREEFVLF